MTANTSTKKLVSSTTPMAAAKSAWAFHCFEVSRAFRCVDPRQHTKEAR
jgi:hypothetical protein